MTNKQIAQAFATLADLMELNEEDDFRIKSYRFAYVTVRKVDQPLAQMTDAEVKSLKGIGPAISAKIKELVTTGKMTALEQYKEKVPAGVVEMLQLDGFGPKKVRVMWKDLGVESIGELRYACEENRLIELKGFGPKTQSDLIRSIEYYERGAGKLRFDTAEDLAEQVRLLLQAADPTAEVRFVGELRRLQPIVTQAEILIASSQDKEFLLERLQENGKQAGLELTTQSQEKCADVTFAEGGTTIKVWFCQPDELGSKLFYYTADAEFLECFLDRTIGLDFKGLTTETAVFERAGLPLIEAEIREGNRSIELASKGQLPKLIRQEEIRGLIHAHSTWSDGANTLEEMARHAQSLGYQYLGITDHSQAAFYANGLKPERVREQWAQIDALNQTLAPFRILKGIEADILNDGSLDYDEATLSGFDFVIASVHTNLKMTKDKATERVLKAIKNPYTSILGHPTGRLLLSRQGYQLDWPVIFEACAKHGVAIEINANPYRLDLDYRLVPQAVEMGVKICVNPDAHSLRGMSDIRYGIHTARKGYLRAEDCLNCLEADAFLKCM